MIGPRVSLAAFGGREKPPRRGLPAVHIDPVPDESVTAPDDKERGLNINISAHAPEEILSNCHTPRGERC